MAEEENPCLNMVVGGVLGAIGGFFVGLGIGHLFSEPLLFPGDLMLFGALLFGLLGLMFGNGLLEWLFQAIVHWW